MGVLGRKPEVQYRGRKNEAGVPRVNPASEAAALAERTRTSDDRTPHSRKPQDGSKLDEI